jgi:hypothetical protein
LIQSVAGPRGAISFSWPPRAFAASGDFGRTTSSARVLLACAAPFRPHDVFRKPPYESAGGLRGAEGKNARDRKPSAFKLSAADKFVAQVPRQHAPAREAMVRTYSTRTGYKPHGDTGLRELSQTCPGGASNGPLRPASNPHSAPSRQPRAASSSIPTF